MIHLVFGASGEGKTTLVKNLVNKSNLSNIVISTELSEIHNDRTIMNLDFDFIDIPLNKLFKANCIYVFDEAYALDLDVKKRYTYMKSFFVKARKYNSPVYLLYHDIGQVPIRMFSYFTHIVGFNAEIDLEVQKRRLKSFTYVQEFLNKYNPKKLKKYEKVIHKRY